ncbi:MAG: amidohydrolase [Candidatus Eisenbacteria bacterium]
MRGPLRAIEGTILAGERLVAGGRVVFRLHGAIEEPGQAAEGVWRLAPEEILLPALHDHHTHLIGTYRPARGPDLSGIATREAALAAVAGWLAAHPDADPVVGEGWDESAWSDDRRKLTRGDLDRIEPRRRVALRRVCGHLAVLNGAAWRDLAPAGAEADPATGTIVETLALGLPARWPDAPEGAIEGARAGQCAAFANGVRGIDEMGRAETFEAYERLARAGELSIEVRHQLPLDRIEEIERQGIRPGDGTPPLSLRGLKAFLDGSLGARTAALSVPYADREDRGLLLWESGALRDAAQRGASLGFAIVLHAIGARAIAQAIDVLSEIPPAPSGFPHRIEHAEDLAPGEIARASRAGIAFSMQPNFTARWQQAGGMYEAALGRERARRLNPYRSVRAGGARLCLGSDTMPFGPWAGLPGACAHPDPAERLPAATALHAYARDGVGPEPAASRLAAGAPADLLVVSAPGGDLDRAVARGEARVVWCAIGGRTVHVDVSRASSLPSRFLLPGEEGSAVR